MTEAEYLTSTDPAAMLAGLNSPTASYGFHLAFDNKPSERKLRLIDSACIDLLDCNLAALLHAKGPALAHAAALLRDIIGNPFHPMTFRCTWCAGDGLDSHEDDERKCTLCKGKGFVVPSWLTKTVLALAQAAYDQPGRMCEQCEGKGGHQWNLGDGNVDEGSCAACNGTGRIEDGSLDPDRLAVLADCLEESGCESAELLNHLRSAGPHVRGCHALDALLGLA